MIIDLTREDSDGVAYHNQSKSAFHATRPDSDEHDQKCDDEEPGNNVEEAITPSHQFLNWHDVNNRYAVTDLDKSPNDIRTSHYDVGNDTVGHVKDHPYDTTCHIHPGNHHGRRLNRHGGHVSYQGFHLSHDVDPLNFSSPGNVNQHFFEDKYITNPEENCPDESPDTREVASLGLLSHGPSSASKGSPPLRSPPKSPSTKSPYNPPNSRKIGIAFKPLDEMVAMKCSFSDSSLDKCGIHKDSFARQSSSLASSHNGRESYHPEHHQDPGRHPPQRERQVKYDTAENARATVEATKLEKTLNVVLNDTSFTNFADTSPDPIIVEETNGGMDESTDSFPPLLNRYADYQSSQSSEPSFSLSEPPPSLIFRKNRCHNGKSIDQNQGTIENRDPICKIVSGRSPKSDDSLQRSRNSSGIGHLPSGREENLEKDESSTLQSLSLSFPTPPTFSSFPILPLGDLTLDQFLPDLALQGTSKSITSSDLRTFEGYRRQSYIYLTKRPHCRLVSSSLDTSQPQLTHTPLASSSTPSPPSCSSSQSTPVSIAHPPHQPYPLSALLRLLSALPPLPPSMIPPWLSELALYTFAATVATTAILASLKVTQYLSSFSSSPSPSLNPLLIGGALSRNISGAFDSTNFCAVSPVSSASSSSIVPCPRSSTPTPPHPDAPRPLIAKTVGEIRPLDLQQSTKNEYVPTADAFLYWNDSGKKGQVVSFSHFHRLLHRGDIESITFVDRNLIFFSRGINESMCADTVGSREFSYDHWRFHDHRHFHTFLPPGSERMVVETALDLGVPNLQSLPSSSFKSEYRSAASHNFHGDLRENLSVVGEGSFCIDNFSNSCRHQINHREGNSGFKTEVERTTLGQWLNEGYSVFCRQPLSRVAEFFLQSDQSQRKSVADSYTGGLEGLDKNITVFDPQQHQLYPAERAGEVLKDVTADLPSPDLEVVGRLAKNKQEQGAGSIHPYSTYTMNTQTFPFSNRYEECGIEASETRNQSSPPSPSFFSQHSHHIPLDASPSSSSSSCTSSNLSSSSTLSSSLTSIVLDAFLDGLCIAASAAFVGWLVGGFGSSSGPRDSSWSFSNFLGLSPSSYFCRLDASAKRKNNSPSPPLTTFDDVAGQQGIKKELKQIISFLKNPIPFYSLGVRPPRGILLEGPSGTGKTLIARAVAGEAGVPFFYAPASSFVEIYIGQGAARLREIFAEARRSSPAIIFLDEIDALGSHRGVGGGDGNGFGGGSMQEHVQTVNQLLTELDGVDNHENALAKAASLIRGNHKRNLAAKNLNNVLCKDSDSTKILHEDAETIFELGNKNNGDDLKDLGDDSTCDRAVRWTFSKLRELKKTMQIAYKRFVFRPLSSSRISDIGNHGRDGDNHGDPEIEDMIKMLKDLSFPVIVMAATNRRSALDSALIRPGRFDKILHFGLPDLNERSEILAIHSMSKSIDLDTADFDFIAKNTEGFSGADLEVLMNEAALLAIRNDDSGSTDDHDCGGIDDCTVNDTMDGDRHQSHDDGEWGKNVGLQTEGKCGIRRAASTLSPSPTGLSSSLPKIKMKHILEAFRKLSDRLSTQVPPSSLDEIALSTAATIAAATAAEKSASDFSNRLIRLVQQNQVGNISTYDDQQHTQH